MFKAFLEFLESKDRKRVILDRESKSPYLTRYYLFLKDRKRFFFNIFLHNFHRSDPDDLHDHPWPYFTLILKGGYWEWIPTHNAVHGCINGEQRVWRGPGHFRVCRAKSYHRIEIEPTVDCWTLFVPGPQTREWGFLTHREWKFGSFKWVKFDQYIQKKTNRE